MIVKLCWWRQKKRNEDFSHFFLFKGESEKNEAERKRLREKFMMFSLRFLKFKFFTELMTSDDFYLIDSTRRANQKVKNRFFAMVNIAERKITTQTERESESDQHDIEKRNSASGEGKPIILIKKRAVIRR